MSSAAPNLRDLRPAEGVDIADTLEPPVQHLRDKLVSLAGLADLPPVRPLVAGLLYRDTLAQIAGAPGSYKSFLTLALACSVALGRSFEGHRVPEAGTVVYVAAEGATGLRPRLLAWCESQRVNPADLEGRLFILPEPLQLGDLVDVTEACEVASELGASLLVLDTRARCTLGLDENSSTEQGRAIHNADKILKASGATVLLVHHTGRSGDHGRGSNSWDGAVWSDLRCKGEELRAVVSCVKHKDVPDGCDHHFRLLPHNVSEELLPRLPGEDDFDWAQRRSTLTVVQNGTWTDDPDDRRSTREVLDVFRTAAGQEGLTRAQAVDLSSERNVSRSAVYEAVKVLVMRGAIRNVGTEKRARYITSAEPMLGGEQ